MVSQFPPASATHWWLQLLVLSYASVLLTSCSAFSCAPLSSPAGHRGSARMQPLAAAATAVSMIWDGPAWEHLRADDDEDSVTGIARAVVGTTKEQVRVVGLEVLDKDDDTSTSTTTLQDGTVLYADSVATVPLSSSITDSQAAATLLQSIPVHTVWPRAEAVGGSTTSHHVDEPTAVVVGSTDSDTVAPVLAALGARVTVVGTKDTTKKESNNNNVQFLSNKNDTPFCDTIGQFDLLMDTLSDPGPRVRERLASDHGCHGVISTVSASARIVQQHGLFQGPKRAQQEVMILQQRQQHAHYRPTPGLGDLATRLLATGYTAKDATGTEQRQGWSWAGYWETTLWPTDTSGGMFGYPTNEREDEDDEEEEEDYDEDETATGLVNQLLREQREQTKKKEEEVLPATGLVDRLLREQRDQQKAAELEAQAASSPVVGGSRVTPIVSRQDLQTHIVSAQSTSVVLFTAPFCRTCRYLKPLYNRLAGQQQDIQFFIVPDAATPSGKDLSRLLNVDAVPAIVLFRRGRRWGQTMSLSSIPDPRLTQSLEWLRTDQDWDQAALEKLPRKQQRRR